MVCTYTGCLLAYHRCTLKIIIKSLTRRLKVLLQNLIRCHFGCPPQLFKRVQPARRPFKQINVDDQIFVVSIRVLDLIAFPIRREKLVALSLPAPNQIVLSALR